MIRLLALLLPLILAAPALAEQGLLCRGAIQAAEREARLPPHLLMAIGRIESGRRDPVTGSFHPWPWTINVEGRGYFFASKAEAIAAVQAFWAGGARSIDVGCMQINLRHHPNAFPTLDAAFDPITNARYAARFLTELYAPRNDWSRAASAYHSATAEYAEPYRQRVMSAWTEEMARPFPAVAIPGVPFRLGPSLPAPANAITIRAPMASATFGGAMGGGAMGGGGMLSNGADRLPLPATNAAPTGRGIEAYRLVPTPIAGRGPVQAAFPTGLRDPNGRATATVAMR
ncbi:transglycosylase SLT domain-containing protein [Falsiroseomonas sp. HW251]|uniref:transglycosylase SLT domain-containing protein n=1 Tax=Falsiroseomonas sp. HW251 TaxID=3390998 RepID=UPI003D3114F3